jgi:hypothetical protein
LGGWRWFVAKHYYLLGEIGWLGCCLCHRYKFDGKILVNLEWHYNNTLNKLIKADKTNATEYCIYDYQDNRVRSVVEFNNQAQSQRDYLPLLFGWMAMVCCQALLFAW